MSPQVSAIVPFYGVEDYLEACLRTIAAQTYRDFECLLIDDGSLDGSAAIARTFADNDRRFRVISQANAGLGAARNTGTAHAGGEYLIYLDSDDLVAPRAFEQYVTSLERSGSDFAASHVWRLPLTRPVETSWAHREPFAERRERTSIRQIPLLMRDRMAWNKMWRRSFWEEQGYAWPEMRFEDFPITIKAHLQARAVDTLSDPTYVWRERPVGQSISGQSASLDSVRDRVAAALMVLETVDQLATREVAELVHSHLVDVDLREVLGSLAAADDADRAAVHAQAHTLAEHIDPALVRLARPQYQRAYRALLDDQPEVVLAVAREGTSAPTTAPLARRVAGKAGRIATRATTLARPRPRSAPLVDLRTTPTTFTYRVRVPMTGRLANRAHVTACVGAVEPEVRTGVQLDGDLMVQLTFDTLDLATQSGRHRIELDIAAGPVRWQGVVKASVDQLHGVHRAGYWVQAETIDGILAIERFDRATVIEQVQISDGHLVLRTSLDEGTLGIERPWPQQPLTAPIAEHEARFALTELVADDPADNPVTDIASRRIVVLRRDGAAEDTRMTTAPVRTNAGHREVEVRPTGNGTAYLVHRPLPRL